MVGVFEKGVGVPLEFTGEVAVVTGAGAGIGRAVAMNLAAQGAAVLALDVNVDDLTQTQALAAEQGHAITSFVCDVSNLQEVKKAFDFADRNLGPCTIMVAAAGIGLYVDYLEMQEAQMNRVIDVNLKGPLLCAQESMNRMREVGRGNIVFIASIQATISLRGSVVYTATKAGLVAAARTLSIEGGDLNIRVNSVSPGTIDTPMLRRDLSSITPEEAENSLENINAANVLGRVGKASEVADAVAFLVSNRASYITGTDLRVDAGFSALKHM